MSRLPIFRHYRVPRRETIREWFSITAAYTVFFGLLWAAYELSFHL